MKRFGFIGIGSMGSMLVKGFIGSGKINQDQIIVTRKDKSRLGEIKLVWPGVHTAQDTSDVADWADFIFICVKPLEFKNILDEIKEHIQLGKHIISTAGSVTIKDIESIAGCKITKVIPTITSDVNEGISLICHSSKVSNEDADFIESLIGSISKVKCIEEKDFGLASELTSCGPGFMAAVFREFTQAALRHTDAFTKGEAEEMVLETLYGTAKLILEKKISFDEVVSRVATKGGITEEGVKVIEKYLPDVFDELFDKTMDKRRLVSDKVKRDFCNHI